MFRRSLIVALVVSVAIHIAAVAMTLKSKPDLEFEGGGETQHAVLGESPFNMVAAGSIEQTVRTEPVETETLQTPEPVVSEPEKPIERVQTARRVTAERAAKAPVETVQAIQPVRTSEPIQPVQTNRPVRQPDSQQVIALPTDAKPVLATSSQQKPVSEVLPGDPAVTPAEAEEVTAEQVTVQNATEPAVSPAEAKPAKAAPQIEPAPPIKAEPIAKSAPVEIPVAEVQEPETQPVETTEAEAHPAPRQKPAPPKRVAKAETEKKVQTPVKQKRQANQNSKNGSGGKSGSTAQEGGSQRRAKSKQAGNSDVTNYPAKVHRKLVRSVRKPQGKRTARKDAQVQFTIRKNGSVTNVRLVRSSGLKTFDQAVLKGVQRAAPFPPIPGAAGKNSWTFTLPVAMR